MHGHGVVDAGIRDGESIPDIANDLNPGPVLSIDVDPPSRADGSASEIHSPHDVRIVGAVRER
jgi:hypothetical protein